MYTYIFIHASTVNRLLLYVRRLPYVPPARTASARVLYCVSCHSHNEQGLLPKGAITGLYGECLWTPCQRLLPS
jgi:hypothetical protein